MKQVIGLDIGRGYVKAYSNFNGKEEVAIFNSVYGGDMSVAYAYIGILWGFTAAASVLAVFLSRRKRA